MTVPNGNTIIGSDHRDDIDTDTIKNDISPETFRSWRQRQKYRENIKAGNHEYNMGGYDVEPRRHSPHELAQCPRKIHYREQNAPRENESPDGVFFVGTQIEEEIVEPYLDDIAEQHNLFVQNSKWVECEIETDDVGAIEIKGSTDPVICDADGDPHICTEIKSTKSLEYLDGPREHHLAQLRAYQYAISQEHGEIPDGLLLYVDKTTLELRVYSPEFDENWFEHYVVDWAASLTEHRLNNELPPADPQQDWECDNCEFKERCGRGDSPVKAQPAEGFLPVTEYPISAIGEYLRAHETARVSPSIAMENPEIADLYNVDPWVCRRCNAQYDWGSLEEDRSFSERPDCPDCAADGKQTPLRGPLPEER